MTPRRFVFVAAVAVLGCDPGSSPADRPPSSSSSAGDAGAGVDDAVEDGSTSGGSAEGSEDGSSDPDTGSTGTGDPSDEDSTDDGDPTDTGADAEVLPTGTLQLSPIPCSGGGDECFDFTVSDCDPTVAPLSGSIKVTHPAGQAQANLIMHKGGGGTAFWGGDLQDDLLAAGFRTIQLRWNSDWQASDGGIKRAACRPATVIGDFLDVVDADYPTSSGLYCGAGMSGGAAAMAYTHAHYGVSLDYVSILSGPPLTRVDYGCYPDHPSTPAPPSFCNGAATMLAVPQVVDMWTQPVAGCGGSEPSAETLDVLRDMSIDAPGATFDWGTRVDGHYCTANVNATSGQGALLFERLGDDGHLHCYDNPGLGGDYGNMASTCNGEKLSDDPQVRATIIQGFVEHCG